jgi:hypothetical protein
MALPQGDTRMSTRAFAFFTTFAAALLMTAVFMWPKSAEGPQHKGLPIETVYKRLRASHLEAMVLEMQCGVKINIETTGIDNESVRWRVLSSGREHLRFTARLTPIAPDDTRVSIEIWNSKDKADAYDGTKFYPRPVMNQPVRPAIEEQVAALIEGRAYKGTGDMVYESNGTFHTPPSDGVCNIQRTSAEEGVAIFRTDDDLTADR